LLGFISPDPDVPALLRVKDYFRSQILSGQILPGAGLPSIRSAGSSLGVHHLTVAQAYRRLAAEGLVRIKGGVGAFVASEPEGGELLVCSMAWESEDTFAAAVAGEILRQGRVRGHTIASVMVDQNMALLPALKARADRGALRGVWLRGIPGTAAAAAFRVLDECRVPVVALSEYPQARCTVTLDTPAAIRLGTRYLLARGCRRVAMLTSGVDHFPDRAEACRATCEALGASFEMASLPYNEDAPLATYELHGSRSVEALFLRRGRPDGLLITDDVIGRGALAALLRLGLRAPRDVRVCTHARVGSGYPSVFGMAVARMEVDTARVAAAACEMMERALSGEAMAEPRVRLPLRFIAPDQDAVPADPMPTQGTTP